MLADFITVATALWTVAARRPTTPVTSREQRSRQLMVGA